MLQTMLIHAVGGVTYIVDVYLLSANSAIAINTFIRSAIAAGFPTFATYMYEGLGVDWTTSVLEFIRVALIPFPLVFWYYGKVIRGFSRYVFDIG
jgi:MFS transporter, DHA1 family, multidrug resistance protein